MRALGETPRHGDFGLRDARVITPGAPERSVIVPRVAMRGPGQMPPVGSRVPDPEGARLLVEWIVSLRAGSVPVGKKRSRSVAQPRPGTCQPSR